MFCLGEESMTKYIVVAGGVISGVGKGVTTASLGKILKEYGYRVTAVKIDPYMNYDAGTLRPTEHGEVWVTDDGGEIDQDLGNYERFLDVAISKKNNLTTGQIYKTIIDKERAGGYLGETVQFIPHVPNEIKRRVTEAAEGYDICLIEIGGTIGDFENIAYFFAMKSLERELGKENITYILVTYLPIPSHIEEMKTKPTQQAIRLLSQNGILPDFIVCRAARALDDVRKRKIEVMGNIPLDHIISEPDIDTIYRIPLDLEKEGVGLKVLNKLHLKPRQKPNWKNWEKLVNGITDPKKEVTIGIVGKYLDIGDYTLADSYISINQALLHVGAALGVKVTIFWIDSKEFEQHPEKVKSVGNYDGIIVPGGFGTSGIEGKIAAIKYARENDIPFLGLCYGLQLAIVEFARNVCGITGAHTVEVEEGCSDPVISIQESQRKIVEERKYGGTMRLGAYAAVLKKGSQIAKLYHDTNRDVKDEKRIKELQKQGDQEFRLGKLGHGPVVLERHRHRYEVNPEYIDKIESQGLVFSGHHEREDGTLLMEFIELPKNKFHIGTQAHPEFKSNLEDPAPLFLGFIEAALRK